MTPEKTLPACPECGGHRYKTVGPRSLITWSWRLNPVIFVNELLLGQRIPSEYHECLNCKLPYRLRVFIHCPACDGMFRQLYRSPTGGLGHWYGLLCPLCEAPVPPLLSYGSQFLLFITGPLRRPIDRRWGTRWRDWSRRRQLASYRELPPAGELRPKYLRMGVFFGVAMATLFSIQILITNALAGINLNSGFGLRLIAVQLLTCWLIFGLAGSVFFGLMMRLILERKRK